MDRQQSPLRYLTGYKQLIIFPKAGHGLLVTLNRERWRGSVARFLKGV